MRQSWTDDRLDDLREDMDRNFAVSREEVTREFVGVDADVRELRVELREMRSEMSARFDTTQRTLLILAGGLLASVAATILAAVFG